MKTSSVTTIVQVDVRGKRVRLQRLDPGHKSYSSSTQLVYLTQLVMISW